MVPKSQCKQGDVTASWNNDGSVAAAAASDGAPRIKLKKQQSTSGDGAGKPSARKVMRQHQAQWWYNARQCDSIRHNGGGFATALVMQLVLVSQEKKML